jgi:hypothetical protein
MEIPLSAHRPTIGDNRANRVVPLLSHAHLPHGPERDKSAEVALTHQPKVCNPSAEGLLRPVSRTCTPNLAEPLCTFAQSRSSPSWPGSVA